MTFEECCSDVGVKFGWGIYDGECTACLEGSSASDADRSSLHHLDTPHGSMQPHSLSVCLSVCLSHSLE